MSVGQHHKNIHCLRRTSSLFFLLAATAAGATELHLKQVMSWLPLSNCNFGWLLLADTDHDGLGEIIHNPGRHFQIAEYRPVDRYVLVVSDTGGYPRPESILRGNFWPHDVGDVDRDGLLDLVGVAAYSSGGEDYYPICVFESHDSLSYPDSPVWWNNRPPHSGTAYAPALYADLDHDSFTDIVTNWGNDSTAVFENVGNDLESLVCTAYHEYGGMYPTVGDFDLNGRNEYSFSSGSRDYIVECTGGNQYALVCSLPGCLNADDRFSGRDVDRNGRPEYFEQSYRPSDGCHTLCQFEAPLEHQYVCDTVDSVSGTPFRCGHSLCADVDGDSLEEIIWGVGRRLLILQPTGPHQYERVFDYPYIGTNLSMCNAADFNRNGYKEIYVGASSDLGSLAFEVECVRVEWPDTNRSFRPGDTCMIRWRVLQPPRCDSVSLFLLTDTMVRTGEWFWRLDTMITGLAPTESSSAWVVPDTTIPWAKVLAIAYGPGWQFDESYRAFQIAPVGARETPALAPAEWALSVSPNPVGERTVVSYDVPTASELSLSLYDASGRKVTALASGEHTPGRYSRPLPRGSLTPEPQHPSAGIYFLRLEAAKQRLTRKLVVQR